MAPGRKPSAPILIILNTGTFRLRRKAVARTLNYACGGSDSASLFGRLEDESGASTLVFIVEGEPWDFELTGVIARASRQ